jgi:hypothetical protein
VLVEADAEREDLGQDAFGVPVTVTVDQGGRLFEGLTGLLIEPDLTTC